MSTPHNLSLTAGSNIQIYFSPFVILLCRRKMHMFSKKDTDIYKDFDPKNPSHHYFSKLLHKFSTFK